MRTRLRKCAQSWTFRRPIQLRGYAVTRLRGYAHVQHLDERVVYPCISAELCRRSHVTTGALAACICSSTGELFRRKAACVRAYARVFTSLGVCECANMKSGELIRCQGWQSLMLSHGLRSRTPIGTLARVLSVIVKLAETAE